MSESLEPSGTQLESEGFISPLRAMVMELHEVHEELVASGFDPKTAAQIVAHMLSDQVSYREGYESGLVQIEIDVDDEEMDDDEDDGSLT